MNRLAPWMLSFRHLMTEELRGLHDRMNATTLYVTHDQLEAMSMADRIMVMNHGVIEQLATPQEIYDRPLTMFVADFIGSPPMSFLDFESGTAMGQDSVPLNGAAVRVPPLREERAPGRMTLGVRPEHVGFSDSSDLRGEIFGTEYLGTTQVVTVNTGHGQVKARVSASDPVTVGETVGLTFHADRLAVFDAVTGRAVMSDFYLQSPAGGAHG